MASMCSLAQHTTAGWSNSFVGATIGADSLETWSRGWSGSTPCGPTEPCAVLRRRLLRTHQDPSAPSQTFTRTSGSTSPTGPRAAIERTDEESKQGPRAPKHTYSLADYGLTEDQVKERFGVVAVAGTPHRAVPHSARGCTNFP